VATIFKRKNSRSKNSCWSIRWWDAESSKWRECIGFTDKAVSLRRGEQLENEAGKRASGMVNPVDAQKNRPICEHLKEFIDGKIATGRTPKQISEVQNKITRIIAGSHPSSGGNHKI
jgi:hypothetical protein